MGTSIATKRPGPYRFVSDSELRDIFYLTPQKGTTVMAPFNITTPNFPHSTDPAVMSLLRELLYLFKMSVAERLQLRKRIETILNDREHIPIRAKLISLMSRIREQPWAYPALLDTKMCKELYAKLNQVAEVSDTVATVGSDPVSDIGVGAGLRKIFMSVQGSAAVKSVTAGMAAFAVSLTRFFGGKSKDYYAFYARRISNELALRGIPPSTLQ